MDTTEAGIFGVQVTLVGLFMTVSFENVSFYPLVGLFLGIAGTAIVLTALFSQTWE